MIDPVIEARFAIVVRAIAEIAKPFAFAKRGPRLYRSLHGNINIIEFQRSVTSNVSHLRFTINVGVVQTRLAALHELNLKTVGTVHAHLDRRLGTFLANPQDRWWDVEPTSVQEEVIGEISNLLLQKAIPYLDAHSSDQALMTLWRDGRFTGRTTAQCERYLALMQSAF